MASAGTLWVSVKPSLEGFGASLREQLAAEAPKDLRIKVTADADVGKATAEVALLNKEVDKVDGRKIEFKTGEAVASLGTLTNAIIGLGPALIPITAVAAGVLGGMGVAAGAAAVGVAAIPLAFSGFGGALKAQDALNAAIDQYGAGSKQAAAATANYEKALDKLTPAAQNFVTFYTAQMRPIFTEMKTAASAGLFPGLQAGLASATPALHQFATLIGTVSTAMGDLAKQAGAALAGPFWHQFFDFLNKTAGPAIKDLATAFGNLVQGVAGMMQALYQPVFVPFMNWFKELSQRVAQFGTSAAGGTNSAFNSFLQYVKDNGPVVAELLKQLALLMKTIVEALAGQGALVLQALVTLLQWINSLPPVVVQLLIDLFIAIKLAKLGGALISDLRTVVALLGSEGAMGWLTKITASGGLYKALGIAAVLAGLYETGRLLKEHTSALPKDAATGETKRNADIGERASDAGDTAGKLLTGDVGGVFDKLKRDIHDAPQQWEDFIGRMQADWSELANWLSGRWDEFKVKFADLWTNIKNIGTSVWNGIAGVFKAVWGGIAGWFQTVWERNRDWIMVVWNALAGFFTGIWNGIKNVAMAVWGAISDFFISKWNALKAAWDFVWNAISTFFSTIWNGIRNTVVSAWEAIVSFLQPGISGFSNFFTNVWNGISSFFSGIWNTISNTVRSAWNGIWGFISGAVNTFVGWWSGIWDAISSKFSAIWQGLSSFVQTAWDNVLGIIKGAINKVIDFINVLIGDPGGSSGVNWVLSHLGIATIPNIPKLEAGGTVTWGNDLSKLASGGAVPTGAGFVTNGPVAVVGEGNQSFPEFVIPTDPKYRGRARDLYSALGPQLLEAGGVIPMLAAGGFVPPDPKSASGSVQGTSSVDWGKVIEFVTNIPKWIADQIQAIKDSVGHAMMADIAGASVSKVVHGIGDKVSAAFNAVSSFIGGDFGGAGGAAGAGQVGAWVNEALGLIAYPLTYGAGIMHQIRTESGGNPRAINLTDSNAQAGHPSKGIMQTIDSTFNSYAIPGHGDIWNPVDNIAAASRYAMARYGAGWFNDGSWHDHGYDGGGLARLAGLIPKLTNKPERVLSPGQTLDFHRLVDWLTVGKLPTGQFDVARVGASVRDRAGALVNEMHNYQLPGTSVDDFSDRVMFKLRHAQHAGVYAR